jgi:hypothetical protein
VEKNFENTWRISLSVKKQKSTERFANAPSFLKSKIPEFHSGNKPESRKRVSLGASHF